nr:helix-turn-helix transcriptional regulator [Curvibacter sp. AEP1-3]
MSQRQLPPQKSFGLRIKELRYEKSLTQEDLADRTGMFRTYLSRIEAGLANPTLTMLHTLAGALEVEIEELFSPAKSVPPKVKSAKPISRGRVKR